MKNATSRVYLAAGPLGVWLLAFCLSSCVAAGSSPLQSRPSSGRFETVREVPSERPSEQPSERPSAPPIPAIDVLLPEEVTVVVGGDVLLWGRVARELENSGSEALADDQLASLFRGADLAMVNLEMAVTTRGSPVPDKQFNFRGDPETLNWLTDYMGVDLVGLANNHVIDYGAEGLLDTFDALDEKEIAYIGAGKTLSRAKEPFVAEIGGKRIAFLAASRIIPFMYWYAQETSPGVFSTYDPAMLHEQIELAKESSDYVVVYVHWGVERASTPEKYQVALAHGYIDHGADMVIGAHPHVLQGVEMYKGKPIAYSLGNFIFTTSAPDTCALVLHFGEETYMQVRPCKISSPKTTLITDEETVKQKLNMIEKLSFCARLDESGRVWPSEE